MEQKKPINHLIAGLIIAGVLIVFSFAMYFGGLQQSGAGWLQYCIIIGGLMIFINLYGKAKDSQVGFGDLFAYGFKTAAFLTLIMIAFTVIFFLAFPEIKEKIFEITRQQMEKSGNLTDDEIEKKLGQLQSSFWVFTIGGVVLVYAIIGAIGSALGAAITKKKPISSLDQMN